MLACLIVLLNYVAVPKLQYFLEIITNQLIVQDLIGAATMNWLVINYFTTEKSKFSDSSGLDVNIFWFLSSDSKLNMFVLWSKQDIWGHHLNIFWYQHQVEVGRYSNKLNM